MTIRAMAPTTCGAFTGDPTDAPATTTTGGTSLRYDSTPNQYVYNRSTPGAGGYRLFLGDVPAFAGA